MSDNKISILMELAERAVYEYKGESLSNNERDILEQSLLKKPLKKIVLRDDPDKNVNTRMSQDLWDLLSEALGEEVTKRNVLGILIGLQRRQKRSQSAKSKVDTRLSDRVALRGSASTSGLTVVNTTLFSRAIWKLSSEHEREQAQGNGSQREEVGENLPATTTLLNSSMPRSSKLKKFVKSGLALLIVGGVFGTCYGLSWLANWYGIKSYLAGNLPQAQSAFNWALKTDPLNLWSAETHYNLGGLYEAQQNYQQAQAEYQRAMELGLLEAYNNQARLYILKGNYSAAVVLLQFGIRLTKNEAPEDRYNFFKNLGWARLEQGSVEEAEIELEQAIALQGDRAAAYCLLAQVLDRQGEKKQAVSHWEDCLAYTHLPRTPEEDKWIRLGQQRLKAAYGESK